MNGQVLEKAIQVSLLDLPYMTTCCFKRCLLFNVCPKFWWSFPFLTSTLIQTGGSTTNNRELVSLRLTHNSHLKWCPNCPRKTGDSQRITSWGVSPEVVVLTPHVRPKAASEKHAFGRGGGGEGWPATMLKINDDIGEAHGFCFFQRSKFCLIGYGVDLQWLTKH